jgi:hypothetical protein
MDWKPLTYRVEQDPTRTDHITLQQLKKHSGDNPGLLADLRGVILPPYTAFTLAPLGHT